MRLRTELVRMRSYDVTRGIQRSESEGTSALRLACRMMLDARRDASQNQPAVCNTAVHTGRMAPDSTPSAKLCEAPGNEKCWLSDWRDLARSLPGKNVSSVQCINGGEIWNPKHCSHKNVNILQIKWTTTTTAISMRKHIYFKHSSHHHHHSAKYDEFHR
jgi:hypothetical protein